MANLRNENKGTIAFIPDERLSREKSAILSRAINTLRHSTKIDILKGSTSEAELLERLEAGNYSLVIVPWYRYLAWSKIEAYYGLTRNTGPTLAGYFAESVKPYEIGESPEHLRGILLDFCHLQTSEILVLLKSLLTDTQRSGLKPLLEPRTTVYTENWFSSSGHGDRVEKLFSLPELERNTWKKRTNAIRIALGAFWSLVYEEGHAKSEAMHRQNLQHPKASFQLGSDLSVLAFRLCYPLSGKGAKDILSYFWPNSAQPTHPVQLLHRYCDFVRVHLISETNDIEVVAGFFPSAPAEKAFGQLHTLWIEPISARTVSEIPYELPNTQNPHLASFPLLGAEAAVNNAELISPEYAAAPSLLLGTSAMTMTIPTQTLGDLSSIDPQTLLNTFSERYQETTAKILALEAELNRLTKASDASDFEKRSLANRLEKLTTRQNEWAKQLVALLEQFRAQQNRMRRSG